MSDVDDDRDIVELLRGIDGPRPLPDDLRARIELVTADRPRAMPDDLRARLEASLLEPTQALPPLVRRRLAAQLTDRTSTFSRVASVAAAVLVLIGTALVATNDSEPDRIDVASPRATTTTERVSAATGSTSAAAGGTSSAGATAAPPPFTEPAAGDGAATSESSSDRAQPDAAPMASPGASSGDAIRVAVRSPGTTVAAGFDAYVAVVNAAGGIHGRPIHVVDDPATAVATVNLGLTPTDPPGGVLFETVHVDDRRLRGTVTSLASPLEAQARLAVTHAFAEDAAGARAAIYFDPTAPWVGVADAFASALGARGATVVRVPFDAAAPAIVDADAAFLALPSTSVGAWLDTAGDEPAPRSGTWGVASAWDDAFADAAAAAALRVLSPYAPGSSEEIHRLGRPLSAERVHGWVTAKALAHLLFRNGGTTITTADLDALAGWDPGWAPPFEVRPQTRARTPEAVLLELGEGSFDVAGDFERAES